MFADLTNNFKSPSCQHEKVMQAGAKAQWEKLSCHLPIILETDGITKFRTAIVGVCIATEQSAASVHQLNWEGEVTSTSLPSGIFTTPVPKLGNMKVNYIMEKSHKALE